MGSQVKTRTTSRKPTHYFAVNLAIKMAASVLVVPFIVVKELVGIRAGSCIYH
jgi:hypothetical protein